jgi:hypothetical protein
MAGDMLRRTLLFLFALPLLAADISGSWMFQVEVGGQSGTPKFTFEQKGEELTGTYSGQLGESKVKGTVKADKVEFEFETQGYRIVYRGTVVSGTEMKGTADYAGQAEGTWTAKKS